MKEQLHGFMTFFNPIPDEELVGFSELFSPVCIRRMDHLYREGDKVNNLYFITGGVFRGYYLKDGGESTCDFFFAPSFVTDLFTVRNGDATMMNIQALRETECYEVAFNKLEEFALTRPALFRAFFLMYEHMLREVIARKMSFVYDTPRERYLKLFKEQPQIIAEIPQHYIANYLGIQPETLSRIRRKIF